MTWLRGVVLTFVFCYGTILAPGTSWAQAAMSLRIGLLPSDSALEVLRESETLKADLEQRLGMQVEVVVGTDYAATVEALRFGRIDVAFLGPVSYVLGSERADFEAFAMPTHEHGATFNALVIAPTSKPVRSLSDLRGVDIAFGDVASTSGHWVPRFMLQSAGLTAGDDYQARFLGSHDAVALAVARGMVAAGVLSRPILERLIADGRISEGAVVVIAESPPIPEYAWTFGPGLDADLREEIREAFLAIDDPAILSVFDAEGFVPASDGDYDVVRQWMESVRTSLDDDSQTR